MNAYIESTYANHTEILEQIKIDDFYRRFQKYMHLNLKIVSKVYHYKGIGVDLKVGKYQKC